jgi:hypothetical protein
VRETLQVLSVNEAYRFMVGFEELTKCDKKMIIYFLEHEYKFKGTYTDLAKDMGYSDTYISEIFRSCHRLQDLRILEISEPYNHYTRTITMNKTWIDTLIEVGSKKCQNSSQEESSQTPLINWETTR